MQVNLAGPDQIVQLLEALVNHQRQPVTPKQEKGVNAQMGFSIKDHHVLRKKYAALP